MIQGIIKRSTSDSFFLRFHEGSKLSDLLFHEKPTYREKEVEVIQVMLISDNYLLAEVVYKMTEKINL